MKMLLKATAAVAALAVVFGVGWLASGIGIGRVADVDSLSDRERAFTERMRNVVLVGHFTIAGREQGDRLPERYEIESVTKLDGDRWRFMARVVYMNVDVTLPVVVPVAWAGDTPMVSLTDVSLPGLGEGFSARVLFYDERYAGTWDHGEYGGLMFGAIEPM